MNRLLTFLFPALLLLALSSSVRAQSPEVVADFDSTTFGFAFWEGCTLRNHLVFSALDPVLSSPTNQVYCLAISDGTASGTFRAGSINGIPKNFTPFADKQKVLFWAQESTGATAWVSDGTVVGTQSLNQTVPGPINIHETYEIGSQIYVWLKRGFADYDLFVSDGTPSGSHFLGNWKTSRPGFHTISPNRLVYFFGNSAQDSIQLFKTNGTPGGTQVVKTFDHQYQPPGGRFLGETRNGKGIYTIYGDVWSSDGTTTGTEMLASFPGEGLFVFPTAFGSDSYMMSDDVVNQTCKIWKTNRSPSQFTMIGNFSPVINASIHEQIGDWFYFGFRSPSGENNLHVLEPNTGNITTVGAIPSYFYNNPKIILPGKDGFFSIMIDTSNSRSFWYFGTQPGEAQEIPFTQEPEIESVFYPENQPGKAYFVGHSGSSLSSSLYSIDGNQMQVDALFSDSAITSLHQIPGRTELYYLTWDATTSQGVLWANSGAAGTSREIKRFGSNVGGATVFGNRSYFISYPSNEERVLWASDGTSIGTVALIDSLVWTSFFYRLERPKSDLYFLGRGPSGNTYVYKIEKDLTTSTEETFDPGDLVVFPNPGKTLNLKWESPAPAEGVVSVYSITGRCVWEQNIAPGTHAIDLPQIGGGVYLVKVAAGGRSLVRRWVKLD